MTKTWVFFKLRMLQLKYDKTAVLFSYIFPALMLLGLGYMKSGEGTITVYYHEADTPQAIVEQLSVNKVIKLTPLYNTSKDVKELIRTRAIKHFLSVSKTENDSPSFTVLHSARVENDVESSAVDGVLRAILNGDASTGLNSHKIHGGGSRLGYLQVILPGLIGMTLLIVGLNGFGHVLIEEKHRGLFKNIKTITVSPAPFLTGLFLSRMLISYTVVALLFTIAIFIFDVSPKVNYGLLALIVTLGAISFLGLGLMLATISPTVQAFTGMVNFVQVPFIVLGGVFFSITAFPDWLHSFAQVIPLTGMNIAMQKIMFPGPGMGLQEIRSEVIVLSVWCVGTLAVSYRRFSW